MKIDALVLQLNDDQWQLFAMQQETVLEKVTSSWPQVDERTKAQQIQNLKTTLTNWGVLQHPTVIIVPDHWCLSSTLTADVNKRQRQNVLFDFEASWPLSIEEVVADYLPGKQSALGVCAELKKLKPIMQAIDELNLNINAICPKALLALQQHLTASNDTSANQYIWADDNAYHWFTVEDRKPAHWQWLSANTKALVLQAQTLALTDNSDLHLKTLDLPLEVANQLKALPQVTSLQSKNETSILDMALTGAQRIATRKTQPWINLQRPPLVTNTQEHALQRVLSVLLMAVIILGVTLAGSMYWRSTQYQQIAQLNHSKQQQLFEELYPGKRIPPNISSRLSSELRAMLKHVNVLSTTDIKTGNISALTLLHEALLSLPADLPMQIQEIRLGNNRIDLRGNADQHAQVQTIANSLRTNTHLQVDTPQMTRATGGKIRYTITANWNPTRRQGDLP